MLNAIEGRQDMIKVLIADDQALIRESLRIILSSHEDLEIVGIVANGKEVLKSIEDNKPDVVLMDIHMPKMDGIQCTKVIREKYPSIKIIILTTYDNDEYIFKTLKYGVSGYLLKGVSTDGLYNAIISVYNGGAIISDEVLPKVIKIFSAMAQNTFKIELDISNISLLTQNDCKIIEQIGYGRSNKEIAQTLYLSEGTVRNYISNILGKLGLRDRSQLAIWAIQMNIANKE